MITCKECGETFDQERSFSGHLRRHKLRTKEYYERHYPMKCLQTGRKLVWKNGDTLQEYLARKFIDKEAMFLYFNGKNNTETKKTLILEGLKDSVDRHGVAPSQAELASLPLVPNLLFIERYFKYSELCKQQGWKTRFDYDLDYSKLPNTLNTKEFSIIVDNREQTPYRYYNAIRGKLDIGDYALGGDKFNKICVERKSVADFWSTMTGAIKGDEETRFKRELLRTRESGCYLIILCEYSLHLLEKYKGYGYANSSFVLHNMRLLLREFGDCCQFVFCNDREHSAVFLVEFLLAGDAVRKYDLQYLVDKRLRPFKEYDFSLEDLNKIF